MGGDDSNSSSKGPRGVQSDAQHVAHTPPSPLYSAAKEDQEVGRLHLAVFETKYISTCLDFIQRQVRALDSEGIQYHVNATGGGAHKYAQLFQEKLGEQ